MALNRREALVLGAVALGSAAAGMLFGPFVRPSTSGSAALQKAVFRDLSGQPLRLAAWRGQVVVCNFWATWCAPCREEMPMLARLHRDHAGKRVQVVGIGIDQADKMAQFATSIGVSYPLLQGDAATLVLLKELGNAAGGLPFTVILDRNGTIRQRRLGVYQRAELETAIRDAAG